jgi:hypothetical protein
MRTWTMRIPWVVIMIWCIGAAWLGAGCDKGEPETKKSVDVSKGAAKGDTSESASAKAMTDRPDPNAEWDTVVPHDWMDKPDPCPPGTAIKKDGFGDVACERPDGTKHGPSTFRDAVGSMATVRNKEGRRHGMLAWWKDDKKGFMRQLIMRDGEIERVTYFHDNGAKREESEHKGEKKHGKTTRYNQDGSVRGVDLYKDGVLVTATSYGDDGKISRVTHYNDKRKATKMEMYKDGKLERTVDMETE